MEAIQDIWADLGTRLRRFVGNRVSDPETANDITQDVMLKVQAQLGSFPPEDKLPAWLFAIARNAIVDHYRARALRDHADIDDVEPADDASDDDDKQKVVSDLAGCLTRMIDLLPAPYREAMTLADIEGLSQQEIADRVGISLSGAKSRVQRARQQLREMVLDCCRVERDVRGNVMDFESGERSSRYCGNNDQGEPNCGR